jgi:hypothetical protein
MSGRLPLLKNAGIDTVIDGTGSGCGCIPSCPIRPRNRLLSIMARAYHPAYA